MVCNRTPSPVPTPTPYCCRHTSHLHFIRPKSHLYLSNRFFLFCFSSRNLLYALLLAFANSSFLLLILSASLIISSFSGLESKWVLNTFFLGCLDLSLFGSSMRFLNTTFLCSGPCTSSLLPSSTLYINGKFQMNVLTHIHHHP